MRSLLFVPGNSAKMISKATASSADVIILDLEDAVHPDAKPEARKIVVEALATASAGYRRYVRINSLDTAWCTEDIEAIIPAGPDGIVLPKSFGPEDVERLGDMIEGLEPPARKGKTGIIVVCTETAASTLSLAAKSWRHPRLTGLMWGGEDLSAAIGASANRDDQGRYTEPFALARSLCLLAARVAGVAPIDAVFTDFRDQDALRRETDAARRDGFSAKAAIHPSQIEVINRCFTPTEDERRYAERVIAAFEGSAKGAVQVDGVMLDAPHLTQARRIMATFSNG
ncbi:CoA ester lyase [Bradyrhizobium symbiodeficiens]|uniref:CoA ester lyase n=1 Tax=Bradyrhizobium symbiodeficiens TaxID=1404367 RepID=A0ABX5W6H5_9BRAD|nr:CoA ester lyase [Bradyrhizobium symbiodeficiens]QDF38805.1 CoA ester lyase [Bradyrhizobium symbiodeficiens]